MAYYSLRSKLTIVCFNTHRYNIPRLSIKIKKVRKQMEKNHTLNATKGPILKPLIAFSLPIMFANILQLLFNAADIIVVGQFVGETAVAAVGSTSVIINLLVSLFTGLSVGATIVISTKVGEGKQDYRASIQTTYTLGVIIGIFTAILGYVLAPFFLELMKTPIDIIGQAKLYLQIYFLGQPGFMIYTFSRAILASKGDTKSPFLFLLFSGVVNVVLNIILVTIVEMGVAGVAIATIMSQYISAFLTTRKLVHTEGAFHLDPKGFCLDREELKKITRLGLPAGLQSTLLSVSGILSQSSFNSLGTVVVAGQSATNNIANFISQSLNAFSQGCMTFISQNYGSGQMDRVRKTLRSTLLIDVIMGSILGICVITFGETLLGIYLPDSEAALRAGMVGITTYMSFIVLMGIQDTLGFALRGMNCSVFPMVSAILGNCVFCIFWILVVFNHFAPTMEVLSAYRLLIIVYPMDWCFIAVMNGVAYIHYMRKYKNSETN